MKTYTLGFLFKNKNTIILAKKMRKGKVGEGKYNGYGGRIEEGEEKIECLVRETEEECGVELDKENCKELGLVDFHFENKEDIGQRVYIYRIDDYEGEPKETEEMGNPQEFDVSKIPYEEMMLGDDEFVPFVVKGKRFEGKVNFNEDGSKLLSCEIKEIKDEKTNEIKMK